MSNSAPQNISLNDIASRYLGAMQHLCDFMVLTWAGAGTVTQANYEETYRNISGLPITKFRFPFELAVTESHRWLLKNSLVEVLGLCVVFLEDVRKVCGVVAFNVAKNTGSGNLVSLAAEINTENSSPDLAARLKDLKGRYGLSIPLEAEMISLAELQRNFLQHGGTVPPQSELVVKLKTVQPPAEGETQPRFLDYAHPFKAGERVVLSREEHAAIFTTASLFLNTTISAVQGYGQASGLIGTPQAS